MQRRRIDKEILNNMVNEGCFLIFFGEWHWEHARLMSPHSTQSVKERHTPADIDDECQCERKTTSVC